MNPLDGRWISRDPIAEQGGRNLYGYVNNSSFKIDHFGLWFGLDDIIFTVGGAIIGIVGQVAYDIVTGQTSSVQSYVASAVGGAVTGEALLYLGSVGPLGFAGAAALGSGITSIINNIGSSEDTEKKLCNIMIDASVGAVTGFIPGLKIPGITIGRGSFLQIYHQISTKVKKLTYSEKPQTILKMFFGINTESSSVRGSITNSAITNTRSAFDSLEGARMMNGGSSNGGYIPSFKGFDNGNPMSPSPGHPNPPAFPGKIIIRTVQSVTVQGTDSSGKKYTITYKKITNEQ